MPRYWEDDRRPHEERPGCLFVIAGLVPGLRFLLTRILGETT